METVTHEQIDHIMDNGFNISFVTMEHNSPYHWHREMEILYILNGNATVDIDKEKHTLHPMELIAIDSSKVHNVIYDMNHTMGICIHISKNFMRRLLPEIELLRIDCSMDILTAENHPAYMQLCEHLTALTILYVSQSTTYALRSQALVLQILAVLIESFSTPMTGTLSVKDLKNLDRLDNIFQYVEQHYKEPVTLQDAADRLMLNKEYFCRFFKQNTGVSFLVYINQVRIHHIYHDLVHTEDATMDIMERHGFVNQKLFYRMFREIYGCTPRQLRTLAKDNPYM
ncbi:MAG: AraC family transcriptional regulator [Hespellia sp.]|nr:AraC family transcriptional regulator [Hespellia sp.]